MAQSAYMQSCHRDLWTTRLVFARVCVCVCAWTDTYSCLHLHLYWCTCGVKMVKMVKNLPGLQETWVQSLVREDLMEKGMATHSSIPGGEGNLVGYNPSDHVHILL